MKYFIMSSSNHLRRHTLKRLSYIIKNSSQGKKRLSSSIKPKTSPSFNQYMQTWVGCDINDLKKSNSTSQSIDSSLIVTGSTYLLPTIRLDRSETILSLSNKLEAVFCNGNSSIRSMLSPQQKLNIIRNDEYEQSTGTFRVPIVLDLKSYQHDGSPHYKPPKDGFLRGLIDVFSKWGINVIGLTNVSHSQDTINQSIQDDIIDLRLPILMSRTGRTLGGTTGKTGCVNSAHTPSMSLDELVEIMISKLNTQSSINHNSLAQIEVSEPIETVETNIHTELSIAFDQSKSNIVTVTNEALQQVSTAQHDKESNSLLKSDESITSLSMESLTAPTHIVGAKIYHGIVRSGQQVSTDSVGQSLVVIGNVSSGGEVMADGDLYVFGKLRGRALAGLSDDHSTSARIIASNFDPELICIGHKFTTIDSVEDLGLKEGSGAMVTLGRNDEFKFETVTI